MSRNLLRDWADLVEDQGWRVISKPGGKYSFYPPSSTVPPDLRVLNLVEPASETHRGTDNNRALLKRAGLKFPEDIARERQRTMQNNFPSATRQAIVTPPVPVSPMAGAPTLDELVAAAHQDINAAVDSLSRLGERLGKIQAVAHASTAGYEKVRALAQALK